MWQCAVLEKAILPNSFRAEQTITCGHVGCLQHTTNFKLQAYFFAASHCPASASTWHCALFFPRPKPSDTHNPCTSLRSLRACSTASLSEEKHAPHLVTAPSCLGKLLVWLSGPGLGAMRGKWHLSSYMSESATCSSSSSFLRPAYSCHHLQEEEMRED